MGFGVSSDALCAGAVGRFGGGSMPRSSPRSLIFPNISLPISPAKADSGARAPPFDELRASSAAAAKNAERTRTLDYLSAPLAPPIADESR